MKSFIIEESEIGGFHLSVLAMGGLEKTPTRGFTYVG